MKGLLIKDLCLMKKHCRTHLIVILFFLIGAFITGETFLLTYPCVLAGLIPTTLLAYDEQSKWLSYSATLPYKRSRIVAVKYVIGFMLILLSLVLTTITALAYQQFRGGGIDLSVLMVQLGSSALCAFQMPAISLPFMFKLGVQKGRTAYFIALAVVFGSITAIPLFLEDVVIPASILVILEKLLLIVPIVLFPAVLLFYAVSCLIAVKLFEKKELN